MIHTYFLHILIKYFSLQGFIHSFNSFMMRIVVSFYSALLEGKVLVFNGTSMVLALVVNQYMAVNMIGYYTHQIKNQPMTSQIIHRAIGWRKYTHPYINQIIAFFLDMILSDFEFGLVYLNFKSTITLVFELLIKMSFSFILWRKQKAGHF